MGKLCALGLGKIVRNDAQERVVWSSPSLGRILCENTQGPRLQGLTQADFVKWGVQPEGGQRPKSFPQPQITVQLWQQKCWEPTTGKYSWVSPATEAVVCGSRVRIWSSSLRWRSLKKSFRFVLFGLVLEVPHKQVERGCHSS